MCESLLAVRTQIRSLSFVRPLVALKLRRVRERIATELAQKGLFAHEMTPQSVTFQVRASFESLRTRGTSEFCRVAFRVDVVPMSIQGGGRREIAVAISTDRRSLYIIEDSLATAITHVFKGRSPTLGRHPRRTTSLSFSFLNKLKLLNYKLPPC